MRKLLNTLFITSEDCYLALEGETVVIYRDDQKAGQFPLHTLEGIISFSYKGASPALMGACAKRGVNLCFMTLQGRFLARVCGENRGNVLLRKEQYRQSDNTAASCLIARNSIFGKVYNSRWSLERTVRDHGMRVDADRIKRVSELLKQELEQIRSETNLDSLRGMEGETAKLYFSVLDELILNQKETFFFTERSRRPPLDNFNAALSFVYTILANDCAAALESVGLDSYVGFLHRDRPGRRSLALDLMEELRPVMADRFVLTLINNRILRSEHFERQESGAVLLTETGRKLVLAQYQNKKREQLTHPYLGEKMAWGLIPYIQALLLARYIRGDLDGYPPFLWK